MKNLNPIKVLKISLGATLSMVLAGLFGLSYAASAGVITILSIQNTKRETLSAVAKRVAAFVMALGISFLCFSLLGYRPAAMAVYLLFFAALCHLFAFDNAIAMDTVLILHFYAERSMGLPLVINEALLLAIGTGMGILMNLYIPSNTASIRQDQAILEAAVKGILSRMGDAILTEEKESYTGDCFTPLDRHLDSMEQKAFENRDNTLWNTTHYYIKYVSMRKKQSHVLKKIFRDIHLLDRVPSQALVISGFFAEISASFHESNNAAGLLAQLEQIKEQMKTEELPLSRTEFENRAVLYLILYELEEFLTLKKEFVENLDSRELERYFP